MNLTPGSLRRLAGVGAAALLAVALMMPLLRITTLGSLSGIRLNAGDWVMGDFKNTVYYPAKAFAEGGNPYDTQSYLARYPASKPFTLYPPATLLLHRPFADLSLETAMRLQAGAIILLSGLLAYVSLRLARVPTRLATILLVWALILLSRPGQWNLLQGQITLPIVLGSYLALVLGRRSSILAGTALALSMFKPNFGLPVAGILLARGAILAVVTGVGLTALLNLPVIGVLADRPGGLEWLTRLFAGSEKTFQPTVIVRSDMNLLRVDAAALVSRWFGAGAGMLVQLVVAVTIISLVAAVVRVHRRRHPVPSPIHDGFAGLACSAILLSVYHMGYDLLLLTWPFVSLIKRLRLDPGQVPARRWGELALLTLLAFNYLASFSAMHAFHPPDSVWLAVSSLNGAALIFLFCIFMWDMLHPALLPYGPVGSANQPYIADRSETDQVLDDRNAT